MVLKIEIKGREIIVCQPLYLAKSGDKLINWIISPDLTNTGDIIMNKLINGDSTEELKNLEENSVDCIVTDPPYALTSVVERFGKKNAAPAKDKDGLYKRLSGGFLGLEWDSNTPSVEIWSECLRVLKPGGFAFVFMTPRQDSLTETMMRMREAGFIMDFTSIYWTYATGMPKGKNVAKEVDRRNGKTGKVIGVKKGHIDFSAKLPGDRSFFENAMHSGKTKTLNITEPETEEARKLNGAYAGFQPKPAVEVIIVAMKPLSESSFTDQALKNGKGITWLNNCRTPIAECENPNQGGGLNNGNSEGNGFQPLSDGTEISEDGRFPANLIVSDNVLNDGQLRKSSKSKNDRSQSGGIWNKSTGKPAGPTYSDSGSFSKHFDLDAWGNKMNISGLPEEVQKTFPWLIVPKPGLKEREAGLESMEYDEVLRRKNIHPTLKPVKILAYLITLGSQEGDVILDPFMGSGSTGVAAKLLKREFTGIEREEEYINIARERIKNYKKYISIVPKRVRRKPKFWD